MYDIYIKVKIDISQWKKKISLYNSEKNAQNNEKIKNPATLKSKGKFLFIN